MNSYEDKKMKTVDLSNIDNKYHEQYLKAQNYSDKNTKNSYKYPTGKQMVNSYIKKQSNKKDSSYSDLKNSYTFSKLEHEKNNQNTKQKNIGKTKQNIQQQYLQNSKTKKKNSQNVINTSEKKQPTKKHSKSVFQQIDEVDQNIQNDKQFLKQHRRSFNHKNSQNKSRMSQYHKQSKNINAHQTSATSVTKRKKSSSIVAKKSNTLSNSNIQQKVYHFKIISKCLKAMAEDEDDVDIDLIIKMIKAFNKSEIAKMSKPLENLISSMMVLLQDIINKRKNNKNKGQMKSDHKIQHHHSYMGYETPQKNNLLDKKQDLSKSGKEFGYQQKKKQHQKGKIYTEPIYDEEDILFSDISKTKKHSLNREERGSAKTFAEEDIELERISELQKSLEQLQNESRQLKDFIQDDIQHNQTRAKEKQIKFLRQILQTQQEFISQIQEDDE